MWRVWHEWLRGDDAEGGLWLRMLQALTKSEQECLRRKSETLECMRTLGSTPGAI